MNNAQGSPEWRKERLGRVTASRFADVMGSIVARASYARLVRDELALLAKVNAGEPIPEFPDFYAAATQWGKANEPIARAEYEFLHDCDVIAPPLQVHERYPFVGASPDGYREHAQVSRLTVGKLRIGLEIKCPFNQVVHATTLAHGVPHEHRPQVQGEMWVCQLDAVDFISFDPRRQDEGRYFEFRVWRDQAYIDELEKRVLSFWEFVLSGESIESKSGTDDVPLLF